MDDFHSYVSSIAEARFAIRKVFRIVDDQAKRVDLDPLQHQLLIQVYGSPNQMRSVKEVAARLDISAAFASRMIRDLERARLVERRPSVEDRRVTEVHISDEGRRIVREIDNDVRTHVTYFQQQLPPESKRTALSIMAFYVGLASPFDDAVDDTVH